MIVAGNYVLSNYRDNAFVKFNLNFHHCYGDYTDAYKQADLIKRRAITNNLPDDAIEHYVAVVPYTESLVHREYGNARYVSATNYTKITD